MQIPEVPMWVWIAVYAITVLAITYLYEKRYVKKEHIEKAKRVISDIIPYVPDPKAKDTLILVLKYLQYLTGEISPEEWRAFKVKVAKELPL